MAKKPNPVPRGYGSVQQEGKGWRAYGNQIQDGGGKKPVRKRFSTEGEGWAWLAELNRTNQNRTLKAGETKTPETVQELLRVFIYYKDDQRKKNGKPDAETIKEYSSMARRYILPSVGEAKLDASNLKQRLRKLQGEIAQQVSEKTKKPLSMPRKRNIWLVLVSAFRFAVEENYISTNPMGNIDQFKVIPGNVRSKAMPKADIDKLYDWLEKQGCQHSRHVCQLRWELALHSGRRQGEILGLKWDDVLLAQEGESVLYVNNKAKSRPWIHGCGAKKADGSYPCKKGGAAYCPRRHGGGIKIEEGTKGGVSVKPSIPLDEDMVQIFLTHRKAQQEEAARAIQMRTMNLQDESHRGMVFTQPLTQRPYGARHDATIFEGIVKEAGLSQRYSVHQLRHTAATELSDSTNGNLPVIADILGHKSITTTRGYISPDMESKADGLAAMKQRRTQRRDSKDSDA